MKELVAHEYAKCLPDMSEAQYASFKESVRVHGIQNPIWLMDGMILDGRTRYRASVELGIECPTREYLGDDPLTFIEINNIRHRMLTTRQSGMAAGRIANLRHGSNQFKDSSNELSTPVPTERAAQMFGVSAATVKRGRRIIQSGCPELIAAVDAGEVGLEAGSRIACAPEAEQKTAIKEIADKKAAAPKAKGESRTDRIQKVASLAQRGYQAEQIARELRLHKATVQKLAADGGITISRISRKQAIDINRVLEETVVAAQGLGVTLNLLEDREDDIDRSLLDGWIEQLNESRADLGKLIRILKGFNDNSRQNSQEIRQECGQL